jgi:3-oxoacyl-[acyl-carrier protein] reductase
MQLAGKVVLVTQSRGHSRGSAARWRWNLLPLAQTRRSQRVADEVRACGRRAILVQADVTLIKQVQAMVSAVQEGLGPIDILINNAGVF